MEIKKVVRQLDGNLVCGDCHDEVINYNNTIDTTCNFCQTVLRGIRVHRGLKGRYRKYRYTSLMSFNRQKIKVLEISKTHLYLRRGYDSIGVYNNDSIANLPIWIMLQGWIKMTYNVTYVTLYLSKISDNSINKTQGDLKMITILIYSLLVVFTFCSNVFLIKECVVEKRVTKNR